MNKEIVLKNRIIGPWSNFESFLLRPENIHIGWVKWINKQTFTLQKNPLCDVPRSPFHYLTYPDIAQRLPENSLIKITDGKEYKNITISDGELFGKYRDRHYVVDQFIKMDFRELPKPYLYNPELEGFPTNRHERIKEFLARITQNWHNAENYELFQKEVAYNLLSCQRDFYGAGGIGAESFVLGGTRKKTKDLISSTKKLLPNEFKIQNDKFQFKFIQNSKDISTIKERRLKVNELSYNDISKLETKTSKQIQIQIPLIVPADIQYSKQKFFDPDVLDYQLYALSMKPFIKIDDAKKFTNLAVKTSQYIGKEYTEESLMLDSFALLKIASSMCRLYLETELKEEMLSSVEKELYSMFKEFADTKKEFQIQGKENRWSELTENARLLYGEIIRISKRKEENGLEWFGLDEVGGKFDNLIIQNSLAELNEIGLIIARNNFTEISLVNYEKTI